LPERLDAIEARVDDHLMSRDEVVRSEGVGGWGLIIVIAVVAALFSMFSQPERNAAPTPTVAPFPSATAAASAQSSAAGTAPIEPSEAAPISLTPTQAALQLRSGFVSARAICPVSTDHHSTLAITLVLLNDTEVTEHITGLSPALPLPGLVDKGATIRSGSCVAPSGKAAKADGQVLPPGTTILVTLHLGLPATCPQPSPVGLDVTLSIEGNIRSEQLSLFNDLGSVAFDTCPTS
jgi:hypothetical protein